MDFKSFTALFLQQATLLLSRATCGLQRQKQTAVRTRTFQKRVECLDVCRWVPGLRSMHWLSVGATVGSNPPPPFFFPLYVRLLTENSWGANWAEEYLDATAQRTTGQKWRRDPKTQRESWTGKTEVGKSRSEGKFQRTETQKTKIEASCSSCSLDRVAESLSSLSSNLLYLYCREMGRLIAMTLAYLAYLLPTAIGAQKQQHRVQHGPCSYTFILPEVDNCRPLKDYQFTDAPQRDSPPEAENDASQSKQRQDQRERPSWQERKLESLESAMENNTQWLQKVFCDMMTEGGGWTVLQHRRNGSVDFHRGWKDYKMGFGEPSGEHWLGNEIIHKLTSSQEYSLHVQLKDREGNEAFSHYDRFYIDGEENNYSLHADGFSGTAGRTSSLTHTGSQFSTKDRDNDSCTCKCAQLASGGWWFEACGPSNLNGIYYPASSNVVRYNGIKWYYWKGPNTMATMTTMMEADGLYLN
uniref:Angiopoietin 2b n=1 Tax=Oryzias latipes TaxID=8090 RepID=A0A3P9LSP1_ORYLA